MRSRYLLPLAILLGCALVCSCGDVSGDPVDGDTEDTGTPDGDDTVIDTEPDTGDDTPEDTGDDTITPDSVEDTVEDTVEPDTTDAVEDVPTRCSTMGGYCTSYPTTGTDPCVTCEDVGGTHYQPARGREAALDCTRAGTDEAPYCCLPVDMTSPPECVTGGGGCYRRPGAGGNICPPGWVEDTTMACWSSQDCCVPGDSCP